jgi:RND family efflux transporter MFP subunit
MRTAVQFFALAILALTLVGCGGLSDKLAEAKDKADRITGKTANPNKEELIIVPVEAEFPMRGSISEYYPKTGNITAEHQVDVVAEGTGDCERVLVEEGDFVKKGQILAELNKDEAKAQLLQQQVQVKQNELAQWRAKEGVDSGVTAPIELDNAQSTLEQSRASLKLQEIQVRNLTIRAPINGVITSRDIQEGQLVSSGVAFQIMNPETLRLEIDVEERNVARMRVGQKAEVTLDALGGEVFEAEVTRINPSVDPATLTVKVVLEFPEDVRKRLRAGSYARMRLVMDTHTDALLLPKNAIREENARKYVFIATQEPVADSAADTLDVPEGEASNSPLDGLDLEQHFFAKRVEIETGLEDSDVVEVLSGISQDSLVITLGHYGLKPDAVVKVTNAEQELTLNAAITPEEALVKAEAMRGDDEKGAPLRTRPRR